MNKIILYSTGCPKCNVLKSKLDSKKIQYETITDVKQMRSKGFLSAPMLQIDDDYYSFSEAVKYLNNIGED